MQHKTTESSYNEAMMGAMLVFVSAIAFSAKTIFVKLAFAYHVDAVTLLALRMLMSMPFFLLMAWMVRNDTAKRLQRKDWVAVVALGLGGMYLSSLLDFLGLQHLSAGMERTVLFIYPTFVVVISAMLSGKAIGRREIGALLLSYFGIVLIAMHEMSFGGSRETLLGAGLVLASAMTYASYLVGSSRAIRNIGTQRFTAYSMIVACSACIAHFGATHALSSLALPARVYELGLAMALLSTVLPTVLLNAGIRRVGGSKASIIASVGPVSTVALAAVYLHEAVTLWQLVGTGLVLAGVLMISVPQEQG